MLKIITYLLTIPPLRRLRCQIAENRLDKAIDRWGSDSVKVQQAYERVRAADFAARYGRPGSRVVRQFVDRYVDQDPLYRDTPVVPRKSLAVFCQARDLRIGLLKRQLQFRSDREYKVCKLLLAASVLVTLLCMFYCLIFVAAAAIPVSYKFSLSGAIVIAFSFLWAIQTNRTVQSLRINDSDRSAVRQLVTVAGAVESSNTVTPFRRRD